MQAGDLVAHAQNAYNLSFTELIDQQRVVRECLKQIDSATSEGRSTERLEWSLSQQIQILNQLIKIHDQAETNLNNRIRGEFV
jgi:hypothetical protein